MRVRVSVAQRETPDAVVAAFNVFEYRDEAPLFRRLSDRFEECVFGLNLVKQEIEEVQGGVYRELHTDLGLDS
jgi:hypothetical protein